MDKIAAAPINEHFPEGVDFDLSKNDAHEYALPCTVENYAQIKRLPIAFLQGLSLSDISLFKHPAVRIPYRDEAGGEHAIRHRTALFKGKDGDNRFRWKMGAKLCLYGLWKLDRNASSVVIVEGESDCHTLWHHDINAVGLPGAGTWNEERDAKYLDSFETIYVVIEPDNGGEAVRDWLGKSSVRDRVKLVALEGVNDVSELHCADPSAFKAAWDKAVEKAEPWAVYEARLREGEEEAQRQIAWAACEVLATSPNILALVEKDLERLNVVGVGREAKLIFLALVSRLLRSHPVSVAVKGPSSAGKSYLIEQILRFMPPSAYYALTAMSEKALAYSDEPLAHRFLVLFEAEGIHSDFASYLIRSLLSEGCVRYETVEKTSEGLRSRLIQRDGPTGLIVTTTRVALHPEIETRLLSITLRDTPDQTKAILMSLAADDGCSDVDTSRWLALQSWLEVSAHSVAIPYSMPLMAMVPPTAVRMRRDAKTVLQLIRAHALLHQASREQDENGSIVATLADYAAIHALVADRIAEGVEASVPKTVRETVKAVAEITAEGASATVKQIAQALNVDHSTASRRCKIASKREYIRNEESSRGRPARYAPADSMPDETKLLPDPEELAAAVNEAVTESLTPNDERPSAEKTTGSQSVCTYAAKLEGSTHPPTPEEPAQSPLRRVVL